MGSGRPTLAVAGTDHPTSSRAMGIGRNSRTTETKATSETRFTLEHLWVVNEQRHDSEVPARDPLSHLPLCLRRPRYYCPLSLAHLQIRFVCLFSISIQHALPCECQQPSSRPSSALITSHLRPVCHLFIADSNGPSVGESKPDPRDICAYISSDPFGQILLLTAQTLRTLAVVIRTELISGILECIAHTAMPNLTDLTLSFNPTRIVVPLEPAPRNPPLANLPRLRHLHIDTCHVFSNTVAPAVALLTAHAPRLATLHVTDVMLMPGCASVLARMVGRLPLRDPYDWVMPDGVLDNTARLLFDRREFALQVRDWPLTFKLELALIERMASMDYGDGFVLLLLNVQMIARCSSGHWVQWPRTVDVLHLT